MLYSIGYQHLADARQLADILNKHQVQILVDVRSRPFSRKAAFNKRVLEAVLAENGVTYLWMGHALGGFRSIKDQDIDRLAKWQHDKRACLMCMEADPDRCHRKNEIARRLEAHSVSVKHLT